MANVVVKNDGTKSAFDAEKIVSGIVAAAAQAGLSVDESNGLADDVLGAIMVEFEGQEEVATSDIRDRVLAELDNVAPAVAEAWRVYEESKEEQ